MDFYDFFSGCGGTSQGMREAGLRVRLGIDLDLDAAKSFQKNFPEADFIRRDIRKVRSRDLATYVDTQKKRPVVFGACAPCQPFSKQRRGQKRKDGRKDLLREFHRFVRSYLPEYIFIENVPGIQSINDKRGTFAKFLRLLKRLKYWHCHEVVSACHYGVPQRRKRLVLVASRLGPITIPKPTHGPGAREKSLPTVWQAIGHLPRIKAGQSHAKVLNHRAASLSDLNLKRIKATKPGTTRKLWPSELVLDCHENHTGHTDVYGRMAKGAPSAALTTRCISLSNGRFGHPTQHRAISVREAACLQTFPMDFEFFGNLTSMSRQVGNAVPVTMARVFGKAIQRHYRTHRKKVG
ncbi:MAG: DNA cytosine methyltransferase [Reyranella sp.]|nr:MAG: DNA cytosine methyltransferase [Reyranella sp.]